MPDDSSTTNTNMMVSSYSTMANQAISRGQYRDALLFYIRALEDYNGDTMVQLVNAAATCFNLGALSKKLGDYSQAANYFRQAESIYRDCRERLNAAAHQEEEKTAEQNTSNCSVCLMKLMVETLQARAHLHSKYQNLLEEAMECHEEVVELLEVVSGKETIFQNIQFLPLTETMRNELLSTSLQFLGKSYVEKGDLADGLLAYQEVLKIFEHSLDQQQRQDETKQIIHALQQIISQKQDLQQLALKKEEEDNWDQALVYWERLLMEKSLEYGEDSLQVAVALHHMARVMAHQGNLEGALDLYQAGSNTMLKKGETLSRDLLETVCDLFSRLHLFVQAIVWLEEIQQPWSFYFLGKFYLEGNDLEKSSQALLKSLKLGLEDEEIYKLLQRVEFLHQRMELTTSISRLALDAISEGIEEDSASKLTMKKSSSSSASDIDSTTDGNDTDNTDDLLSQAMTLAIIPETPKVGDSLALPQHRLYQENNYHDEDDKSNQSLSPIPRNHEMNDPLEDNDRLNFLTTPALDASPFDDDNEGQEKRETIMPGKVLFETQEVNEKERLQEKDNEMLYVASEEEEIEEVDVPASSEKAASTIATRSTVSEPSTPSDTKEEILLTRPLPNVDEVVAAQPKLSTSVPFSEKVQQPSLFNVSNVKETSAHSSSTPSSTGDENNEQMIKTSVSAHDAISLGSTMFISASTFEVHSSQEEEEQSKAESTTIDIDKATSHSRRMFDVEEEQLLACHDDSSSCSSSPFQSTNSASSRTGLLQQQQTPSGTNPEKKGIRVLGSPKTTSPKSHNYSSPTSTSPRDIYKNPILRIKQQYAEMPNRKQRQENNKPRTTKGRFVKALSSPFRRSKNSKRLDALDEDKESFIEDEYSQCEDAPLNFIFDDDDQSQVSQITFRMEDYHYNPSRNKGESDSQWWWGVTKEGLEGWFPSTYVNQAVQAAEGFLSAKSIHDRAKSRPLDFDSEDESDNEEAAEQQSRSFDSKPVLPSPRDTDETSAAPDKSNIANNESSTHSKRQQSLAARIQEKEEILQQEILENGPEHINVASIHYDLAVLYSKSNDIIQALDLTQKALKVQKATLNMANACTSLHFMADLSLKQKQYSNALSFYEESQQLQERVFGYFHEETANTLNRIGNVFATQGEFGHAMENYKEALRILKECCGEEIKNPLVSQTLIQIGAVYYRERNSLATIQSKVDGYTTFIEGGMLEVIGRAHEERGSYRMALAFFEEKLQHLNDNENSNDLEQVAETLNSLGMLSCRAGLYLEAIDYYDRALGIQMKLGCDEVQLAMARVLAGSVQYSLGHFKKALQLFQDAIDTLRDHVGAEQETVAATLFHMGVVRMALCEYDDAMSDFREALKVQQKLLGSDHPATLRTRREIGNLYAVYESELDAAFEEFNEILAMQRKIHGAKHPNVAETLQSIGCAQAKKGEHVIALRTLEDCYNMRLEFLGMDHPLQATTLHEISKIQLHRGRLKKAIHICDAALNIRVESLSEQHIDVAMAMTTKASCLVAQNNFGEANTLFLESISISNKAVGAIHPSVARIYEQIGIMNLRKCHFEEASESIQKALDIYRQSNLDEDHPGIKEALKELERVERAEMLCV
jgi:tetratricopeptide (TPR) repeat protein